ncbi:C6 zinc finger domain protein [Aspergillus heteromorphus CBS 117.55]|uniref:C6 zinc finger domain protein n=1 Tax=Aspergillus heteromorphus CBS 117.55 TaxID=1448321 RepID=A0A317WRJ6_9EURO|nr:C6 zinc finger domain protein [Aspergillus heteromorphus CBS 117.55]PWY89074.1 C6 zinc finger domain protein [Aspergillus heteromorphus CBS 117.55]
MALSPRAGPDPILGRRRLPPPLPPPPPPPASRQHQQQKQHIFLTGKPNRPSPAIKRSKKACTECRQQKAKCNAYLTPDQPCTRCSKLNIQCVISDPFRREHKRKRLSELEQETDELRQRLRFTQPNNDNDPRPSPIAMLTAAAEMEGHSVPTSGGELTLAPDSQTPSVESQQPLLSSINPRPLDLDLGVGVVRALDPTEARSLNNVHLTGCEVDELFRIFFHQYASFLPILDAQTTPNATYTQSPFLFWAIVAVASRTYPQNPTLLMALSRSVVEMAFLSIGSGGSAWCIIQGMLLIQTWPFPKDVNATDVTFPMSGMLLHIAMQHGIHIPMSSNEFLKRKRLPAPSEAEMTRRSELWAHCVIVYQRACVTKGHPPRALMDLEPDGDLKRMLFQRVSPSLALELKCEDLITRCSAAVLEFGVRTLSLDQEKSFDILLRAFDSQAVDLEAQAMSAYDRFSTAMCRLSIQIFHLFRNTSSFSAGCLAQLLSTACNTIDSIHNLGQSMANMATAPMQVNYALLLASAALLRILKGPQWATMDVDKARSSFFSTINLARQMSVDTYDIAAKMAIVMNQLWNSTRAFRKSDGSEYVALRIRSRLVLSPVIDTVWWWRDEFDPQFYNMPSGQNNIADGVDASRDNPGSQGNAPGAAVDRPDFSYFDEQFEADFEWALTDEVLYGHLDTNRSAV